MNGGGAGACSVGGSGGRGGHSCGAGLRVGKIVVTRRAGDEHGNGGVGVHLDLNVRGARRGGRRLGGAGAREERGDAGRRTAARGRREVRAWGEPVATTVGGLAGRRGARGVGGATRVGVGGGRVVLE